MRRHLVLANQTLGGVALQRVIDDRIAAGGEFHVLVPMTPPQYEVVSWAVADAGFALPQPAPDEVAEAQEVAQQRSQHRLERMVTRIEEAGGRAEGSIGPPDPYEAARALLEREHFDEVIVSTLPSSISRWLRMDLPSRLSRGTDVPVTTVEVRD